MTSWHTSSSLGWWEALQFSLSLGRTRTRRRQHAANRRFQSSPLSGSPLKRGPGSLKLRIAVSFQKGTSGVEAARSWASPDVVERSGGQRSAVRSETVATKQNHMRPRRLLAGVLLGVVASLGAALGLSVDGITPAPPGSRTVFSEPGSSPAL